ncbi:MAG: lytic transglycosylase domain-containing protein [Draconibacterium sp.]
MNKKKWWRILLPFIVVLKIVVIVFILGSAKPESKQIVTEVKTEFTSVKIPDSVTFVNEEIPLHRFDVKEALDRELLSNAYFHSQTIRYLKLAPRYFSVIEPILKENGIPDDFKYLALAESGFNPRAVSPASAVGFWQFVKGTAQEYGLEVNSEIDERYHVVKSTYAACEYMKNAYKKYGSWTLVAASYNAGLTGVQRQITRQKTDDYYDLLFVEETQRYVFRIVALKLILENPEEYNFVVSESEKYPIVETKKIEISGPVPDFADFAKENGISYKLLKDFNPWLRDTKLINSGRKKYVVEIPVLN